MSPCLQTSISRRQVWVIQETGNRISNSNKSCVVFAFVVCETHSNGLDQVCYDDYGGDDKAELQLAELFHCLD